MSDESLTESLAQSTTETVGASYRDLDTWPLSKSLAALLESNRRAVEATARALPRLEEAAAGIERCLQKGGRLVYIGAGTSGRLALQDAAELPPTFGFTRTLVLLAGGAAAGGRAQEGAEDDGGAARAAVDEANVSPADAVVGLAASGRTPYTVAGIARARERGAFTVGVANNPSAPLLHAAEVGVLLETGPEVLAGSTRLAAGTAQKVALNALSTAVLVKLGGAYGNLMVGMRPANDKLRARAQRIVGEGAGVSEEDAAGALMETNWHIREALVTLLGDVSAAEARELLSRHQGRVREAVAASKHSGSKIQEEHEPF